MRLKSFTAASLPEAMQAVRAHFGPDAVILSTIDESADGRVRVTAALEAETPKAPAAAAADPLTTLDTLSKSLAFHRVPSGLSDRVLSAAGARPAEDANAALSGALEAEFGFKPFDPETETGPLLLFGPPGGGKTSCAAKLCTLVKLAGRKTNLITMDGGKAGGRHQIAAFAVALDSKLLEATDADSLARALGKLDKSALTVIDTPGANAFDSLDLAGLQEALEASGATPVLVLPAGGDALDDAETAQAFAELGRLRLIPSKLDTARRLGGLLSAAFTGDALLSAGGIAPQIAGGLVPLTPDSMARLLLPDGVVPAENPQITEPLRAAR